MHLKFVSRNSNILIRVMELKICAVIRKRKILQQFYYNDKK